MRMRIDCHADTALLLLENESLLDLPAAHLDYQRIAKYLDIAFLAIFVNQTKHTDDSPAFFRRVLDLLLQDLRLHKKLVKPIRYATQVSRSSSHKRVLIGAEGAACLGIDSEFFKEYYEDGLRLIGLTWNQANRYAGGAFSEGEITEEGYNLIDKCHQKGVVLDAAHLNRKSFWQLLAYSRMPVMVSHTCCAALQDHCRNLDDQQMKALAEQGGVMGINFVPDFLGGEGDLLRVCEHIEYAVKLIGSQHLAIGSDFDGCQPHTDLAGAEHLPSIYQQLSLRGMGDADVENVMGKSAQRLLEEVLPSPPRIVLT